MPKRKKATGTEGGIPVPVSVNPESPDRDNSAPSTRNQVRKTPLDWHASPPHCFTLPRSKLGDNWTVEFHLLGLFGAFNQAWHEGKFRARLNDLMTAEEWLALVIPYLPDQSPQQPYSIKLGYAPWRAK